VGKDIDFRELVYLMNGTLLRVALIRDPVHHRKDILARSRQLNLFAGSAEQFCELYNMLTKFMHSL